MKIWKFYTNKSNYCSYDGFIITASTREEAIDYIKKKYKNSLATNWKNFFCKYIGETEVYKEITVLMESYYEG